MTSENQFINSYKNKIHLYMETLDAYDFNVFFLKKFKRQDNGNKDVLPYDFADYRYNKILLKEKLERIKSNNGVLDIAGLGLITGKISNLTILDIDNVDTFETIKKDLNLTNETISRCVVKTYRGYQLYYKYEPSLNSQSLQPLLNADILNDNKQTFAIPCNHSYTYLNTSQNENNSFLNAIKSIDTMPEILKDYLLNISNNNNETKQTQKDNYNGTTQTHILNILNSHDIVTTQEEPIILWLDKILDFWKENKDNTQLPKHLLERLQIFFCNKDYTIEIWGAWHDLHLRHNFAIHAWTKLNIHDTANSVPNDKREEFFKFFSAYILKYDLTNALDIKKVNNIIKWNNPNFVTYDPEWKKYNLYMQEVRLLLEKSQLNYLEPIDINDEENRDRYVIFLDPRTDKFNLLDMRRNLDSDNPLTIMKGSLKNILNDKKLKKINPHNIMVAFPISDPLRAERLYYDMKAKAWYFNKLIEPLASKKVKHYMDLMSNGAISKNVEPPKATHTLISNIANYNEEVIEFLYNYIATLLKKPQYGHTAIVLKGIGGVGKSVFTSLLTEIFTLQHCNYVSYETFIGQFTGFASDKLILIIDETGENRNTKENKKFHEQIKRFVANEYISIEKKGKEPYVTKNYLNIFITTNAEGNVLSYNTINRRDNEFISSSKNLSELEPFKTLLKEGKTPIMILKEEIEDLFKYLASLPFNEELFRKQIVTKQVNYIYEETTISYDRIVETLYNGSSDYYTKFLKNGINAVDVVNELQKRKHSFILAKELKEWFGTIATELKRKITFRYGEPKKRNLKFFGGKTTDIFIFKELEFLRYTTQPLMEDIPLENVINNKNDIPPLTEEEREEAERLF